MERVITYIDGLTTYRLPLSTPWPEAEKPDPYAELKAAHKAGKVIQQIGHGSGDWFDCGTDIGWTRPVECYRIKPWSLPPPPEGKRWHRDDWTEEMLPEGTRPLLEGELIKQGDEVYMQGKGPWGQATFIRSQASGSFYQLRTRRPLPVEEWVDLEPGDVPPGSVFQKHNDGSYYTPTLVSTSSDGVYFGDSVTFQITYNDLANEWQINRSLPLTGKWDATAWEPCKKLKP